MLRDLLDFFMSMDAHLMAMVTHYGAWTYLLLFLIIFCETGLIVMPFLPGDSLLFIAGGLSSHAESHLSFGVLFFTLVCASFLGNQVNYRVGRWIGPRVFHFPNSWLFNRKRIEEAHAFYQQYGNMTIILARFMPIVRTFVPFIAGVAQMSARAYLRVNFLSAILWIGCLLFAGYSLGQVPFVQQHLNLMIYGIIFLSLLPPLISFAKQRGCRCK